MSENRFVHHVITKTSLLKWAIRYKGSNKISTGAIFEIKLPKSDFNSGETINGKVLIRNTKDLEIEKVYITMTGHEVTKISDTDGNMRTQMQEYFRTKNNLVDTNDSSIINNKEIEFNLLAPRSQKSTDEWKIEVHTDSQKIKSTSSVLIKINNI